jgi:hypothetical protein
MIKLSKLLKTPCMFCGARKSWIESSERLYSCCKCNENVSPACFKFYDDENLLTISYHIKKKYTLYIDYWYDDIDGMSAYNISLNYFNESNPLRIFRDDPKFEITDILDIKDICNKIEKHFKYKNF